MDRKNTSTNKNVKSTSIGGISTNKNKNSNIAKQSIAGSTPLVGLGAAMYSGNIESPTKNKTPKASKTTSGGSLSGNFSNSFHLNGAKSTMSEWK